MVFFMNVGLGLTKRLLCATKPIFTGIVKSINVLVNCFKWCFSRSVSFEGQETVVSEPSTFHFQNLEFETESERDEFIREYNNITTESNTVIEVSTMLRDLLRNGESEPSSHSANGGVDWLYRHAYQSLDINPPLYDEYYDLPQYIQHDDVPAYASSVSGYFSTTLMHNVAGRIKSRQYLAQQLCQLQSIVVWRNRKRIALLVLQRLAERQQASRVIQKQMRAFLRILREKSTKIQYTAFPRLGLENVDGCECWLPDPSTAFDLPVTLLQFLFGKTFKTLKPYKILLKDMYMIKYQFNSKNFIIQKYQENYFVFEANNCHLIEGESDPKIGHSFKELVVVRADRNSYLVLKYLPNNFTLDLSSLVTDQHNHLRLVRSFVNPVKIIPTVVDNDVSSNDMVYVGDTLMTREEKKALRRSRRANASKLRREGLPVPKGWQVPIEYKGLTTQEYHEMRRRRKEEMTQWIEERGHKALPQNVKEWMKSISGADQWHMVHQHAVTRPEFAQKELDKINSYLETIGLIVPLNLNPNLIEQKRKILQRYNENRDRQLLATQMRASPSELAQRHWQTHISKQLENERSLFTREHKTSSTSWADDDSTDLPDLDTLRW
uniref:Uncharacterized protein n=1 Tax=Rhizoctonia cerealis hypovirus TaxID=3068667 RepID=A0AA51BS98_9VIRU|nr:MAG: hypothetical protein [Rhizoctonia cerealis hypovirus]